MQSPLLSAGRKEKEAEREKKAPLASETEVEDKDDEAHGFIFRGEEISDPIPSHLSHD